jgi:predicted HTH domain antitoxin
VPVPRQSWSSIAWSPPALDAGDRRGYLFFMTIVALVVPDDLSQALHVPAERLASEIAFAAATRLYEQGRVSLAKAAEIAGTDRFDFACRLADLGVATATFEPTDVDTANAPAK